MYHYICVISYTYIHLSKKNYIFFSSEYVSVKARQVCIAEVEEIVPVGSLSPEERQKNLLRTRDAAKMVGF